MSTCSVRANCKIFSNSWFSTKDMRSRVQREGWERDGKLHFHPQSGLQIGVEMFSNGIKMYSRSSGADDGSAIGSVWVRGLRATNPNLSFPAARKTSVWLCASPHSWDVNGPRNGWIVFEKCSGGGVCVGIIRGLWRCVFTHNREIPQPDKSYLGTCDSGLLRKFHIHPYHRTSISSLVLDGFQIS